MARSHISGAVLLLWLTGSPVAAQAVAAAATAQGEAQPVPAPIEHTGWSSLLKDTARDFRAFPRRKSTWMLVAIGGAAALALHPADDYVEHHVAGDDTAEDVFRLGKWMGGARVQVASAVGVWATGRYIVSPLLDKAQTNKVSHIGFDLIRAHLETQALVHGIKYSVRRHRPTGECCAFPSGHAATTFAAATVLQRHFGYKAAWPLLLGATYVATSRLVDNRHFLTDVVFGAAVGVATGSTVVARHGRNAYALQPVAVPRGMMVEFTASRTP